MNEKNYNNDDDYLDDDEDDDSSARSQFGTRQYWDDVYLGRGDFPAEEYSWYFGWEILQAHVKEYIPLTTTTTIRITDNGNNNITHDGTSTSNSNSGANEEAVHILCPGIGNDPLLVDLVRSKYTHLTAFDYSEHAIERQRDLLSFELPPTAMDTIELYAMDARKLPNPDWNERFDAIIEKGALDAIYLSGDGNVERALENLCRVLKPGGIFLSVSGVVPKQLRLDMFQNCAWEWIRDGSDELKAGCFILRKKI